MMDLKQKKDCKYPIEIPLFLSKDECACMIKLINGHTKKGIKYPNYIKILMKTKHECIEKIKKRLEDTLNLEKGSIDDLVVFNKYNKSGYVEKHYDDNRKYTFMIYLNDGFKDGSTVFPRINKEVEPKTGKLVIIKSKHDNGKLIIDSEHYSNPTYDKDKYIMGLFIK